MKKFPEYFNTNPMKISELFPEMGLKITAWIRKQHFKEIFKANLFNGIMHYMQNILHY